MTEIQFKNALIDASSAILLFKSDLFERLLTSYHVIMAESVYNEVTRAGYPGAAVFKAGCADRRYRVVRPQNDPKAAQAQRNSRVTLGRGETETIRLYLEGRGQFVIIDDGKGAGICKKQKIPYINALLFPRILYLCRSISEGDHRAKIEEIARLGRYSRRVYDYAASCPRHKLSRFLPA